MAKLTLTAITSGYGTVDALNANFDEIEAALENTLSRDGTAPNTMGANLDMDSHRILNLPDPASNSEPVTKGYADTTYSTDVSDAAASALAAAASEAAAAASAAAAAASATAAATSATAASGSQTAAAASASAASTSETNAASSASAASTSATNASNSASSASTSATNASNSASTASTQATNASNSASSASTSATNASNSASAAATSETNAAASASAASTSETNAAASETAAAASASSAANIVASAKIANLVVKNNTTNPNYQLDITADYIGVVDGSGDIQLLSSISWTVDITVSGANGLDTGAEANSTWYYIWAIAKADGTKASLLSTSSSAPTMPSGYTYKRRIGVVRNNSSGHFVKFRQSNESVFYNNAQTVGGVGVSTGGAFNQFSTYVPPIATDFSFAGAISADSASDGSGHYAVDCSAAVSWDNTNYANINNLLINGLSASGLAQNSGWAFRRMPCPNNTAYATIAQTWGSGTTWTLMYIGYTIDIGI